jgi:hypothetical protein
VAAAAALVVVGRKVPAVLVAAALGPAALEALKMELPAQPILGAVVVVLETPLPHKAAQAAPAS